MTVATTDGDSIWAFRYSSEHDSRSLFFSTEVQTLRHQYPDNPVLHGLSDETRHRALGAARRPGRRMERCTGVDLGGRPGGTGRDAPVQAAERRLSIRVNTPRRSPAGLDTAPRRRCESRRAGTPAPRSSRRRSATRRVRARSRRGRCRCRRSRRSAAAGRAEQGERRSASARPSSRSQRSAEAPRTTSSSARNSAASSQARPR